MDWCSRSNPRKKFKNDAEKESINVRSKSLLTLFIEYASDERDAGQLTGCEDVDLINWLASVSINVNNEFWESSTELDIRTEPKIQLPEIDITKLDKDVVQAVHDWNKQIFHARLSYSLRKVLPFFHNCNDNINYIDEDGRTVLHFVLEEYLEMSEKLPQDQLSKMQSLIKELVARGASTYTIDKRGNSPLHIATASRNEQILTVIISCLINVDERDEEGNTALHIILENCFDEMKADHKNGYMDIIRNLISKGADVKAKNKKGTSAIHLAAGKFYIEVLELLQDSIADFSVSQHTCADETPLHLACKSSLKLRDTSKMVETIDFLVGRAGCEIEAVDKKGYMPLHYAAEFTSVEIVQRLIELGADVHCRTEKVLMTPLHLAAKADRLDVMRKLVELGADVNAKAADGATPIFMSTLLGSFEGMMYLVDKGADLYRRDKLHGYTLLHLAAYDNEEPSKHGTCETEKSSSGKNKLNFLIEQNFDISDPGTCGLTPLHLAVLRFKADTVRVLVEHGANVNFQSDKSDLAALHLASIQTNLIIAEILIKAGADVNSRGGPEKSTPLHFALMRNVQWSLGNIDVNVDECFGEVSSIENVLQEYTSSEYTSQLYFEVMTTLINNGADINAKDTSGRSPLHFATLHDDRRSSKFLLESGAHVNVQDNHGQLPLSNTLKNERVKTLKILLSFGADINDRDISTGIMCGSETNVKNIVVM